MMLYVLQQEAAMFLADKLNSQVASCIQGEHIRV